MPVIKLRRGIRKEIPVIKFSQQLERAQGTRVEASPAHMETLGNIVDAYKSLVANSCLDIYKSKNKTMRKLWQRNYYEHIIRNKKSYQRITEYIINNPGKWKDDKFYYQ